MFGFVGSVVPQGVGTDASVADLAAANTNGGMASPKANTCFDIDEMATGN